MNDAQKLDESLKIFDETELVLEEIIRLNSGTQTELIAHRAFCIIGAFLLHLENHPPKYLEPKLRIVK